MFYMVRFPIRPPLKSFLSPSHFYSISESMQAHPISNRNMHEQHTKALNNHSRKPLNAVAVAEIDYISSSLSLLTASLVFNYLTIAPVNPHIVFTIT